MTDKEQEYLADESAKAVKDDANRCAEYIKTARLEERERILYIVEDYFNLNFGEFSRKYGVSKGELPGDEIRQALGASLKGGK